MLNALLVFNSPTKKRINEKVKGRRIAFYRKKHGTVLSDGKLSWVGQAITFCFVYGRFLRVNSRDADNSLAT